MAISDPMLTTPPAVREIAEKLEAAGFETWCVGGAVRDALLGHHHLDWDLATAAPPSEVQRLFRRTVPVGIQFGTVGVRGSDRRLYEVTTFRRDVETDGRHAVVAFGASLDEDLARRDFTINAIAWSPSRARLHDPFGGRADLERGVVRAVGDPPSRMREDRLRALRALRFAARFGFEIEPRTWDAIVESSQHLSRLSAERVKQEIEKTMEQVPRPGEAFDRWRESGALRALVPVLAESLTDEALGSLNCLPTPHGRRAPQRKMNRLAALFLDLGERAALKALRDLRFSNAESSWVASLAGAWQDLSYSMESAMGARGSAEAAGDAIHERMPGSSQVRHWTARAGRTRVAPLLRLAAARWAVRRERGRPAPEPSLVRELYRRALRSAFRDPLALGDLAIDGADLRAAGVPAGPVLGRILQALLAEVIEDPGRNTRTDLLRRAAELHEQYGAG